VLAEGNRHAFAKPFVFGLAFGRPLLIPAADRQRSRMTPFRQFHPKPVESWAPDWKAKEGQATAKARAKAARLPFGSAQGRKAATKATPERRMPR